jgi:hypothetical protein
MEQNERVEWPGDVLKREEFADYLYHVILKKYQALDEAGTGALCVAIDGDWGTGKTFFVTNWVKDIQLAGHPVVHFDAWKNDLSDEPLLGFIAELRTGLRPLVEKLPSGNRAKVAGVKKLKAVMGHLRRAVLPATLAISKGLMKKGVGLAAEELTDIYRDAESAVEDDPSDSGTKTKDEVLDELFANAIEGHSEKKKAMEETKSSIEELLTHLDDKLEITLPLFVFIDELDRCRPDYAIRLLEGVKHLFDAKGVCFVVSTNISQLSESLRAIYGAGFDARRYLRRLFSYEYVLPDPDFYSFAEVMLRGSDIKRFRNVESGLPPEAKKGRTIEEQVAEIFAFVSRSFGLDLRSQRQVFQVAETAIAGLDESNRLHVFYLFSLAAIRHKDASLLDDAMLLPQQKDAFQKRILAVLNADTDYRYKIDRVNERGHVDRVGAQVACQQLIHFYFERSEKNMVEMHDRYYRHSGEKTYPGTLEASIVSGLPAAREPGAVYLPDIRSYRELISYAGKLVK